MIERIHRGLAGFIWQLLIVAVVVLAVYVSAARVMLELLPSYRSALNDVLSEQIGTRIEIGELSAELIGFTPQLILQDLALQLPGPAENSMAVDNAILSIDMWHSLLALQPRLGGLSLEGMRVEFHADRDTQTESRTDLSTLADILRRFRKVAITNAQIALVSGEKTMAMAMDAELYRERSLRDVRVRLSDDSGLMATIEGRGIGDPLRFDTFSGDYHGFVEGDLNPLLARLDLPMTAQIDTQFWLAIRSGDPVFTVQAELSDIHYAREDQSNTSASLASLKTSARLRQTDNGWRLRLQNLNLTQDNREASLARAQVDVVGGSLALALDSFDVASFSQVLLASKLLPDRAAEIVDTLSPEGQVKALRASVTNVRDPLNGWSLVTEVKDATIHAYKSAPGLYGIDATLEATHEGAIAWIDTVNFGLDLPKVYDKALMFETARGKLEGRWSTGALFLEGGVFDAVAETHSMRVLFGIDIPLSLQGQQESPLAMYLSAAVTDASEDLEARYVPTLLNEGLYAWLASLVPSADINTAAFVWRGGFKNYGKAEQVMQLGLDLNDAAIDFHPAWPNLVDGSATAYIDTNRISVWASQGKSDGVDLADISVEVDVAAGQGQLQIDTQFSGQAEAVIDWLKHSPVSQQAPGLLADLSADGMLAGDVLLGINVLNLSAEPDVEFSVNIVDSTVNSQLLDLAIDELSGTLTFSTDTGFGGENLQAKVFDHPLNIAVGSENASLVGDSVFAGHVETSLPAVAVTDWLFNLAAIDPVSLQQPASGTIDLNVDIDIGAHSLVRVSTTLAETVIDLPAPLAKPAGRAAPLSVEFDLSPDASWRGFWYGVGTLEMYREHGAAIGTTLDLTPRTRHIELPNREVREGLFVTGFLPKLELEPWLSTLSDYRPHVATSGRRVPVNISDLLASEVLLGGVDVGPVQLDLESHLGWDMLGINADWLDAELTLAHEDGLSEDGISSLIINNIDLDRLPTKLSAELDSPMVLTPPDLKTPIDVVIANLTYGQQSLGAATFRLDSTSERLVASGIRGNLVDVDLLDGNELMWSKDDDGSYRTAVNVVAELGDIGRSIRELGSDPVVQSDSGTARGSLNWAGSPLDISLNNLSGSVDLVLREGAFLPVPAGASGFIRVLSVLNLVGLFERANVARLFDPGVAFKSARGEFIFEPGHIIIPGFKVDGSGGGFQIDSDLDLVHQTIDGELVVTLPLADNIPWVAALAGGIPVAAGAYLASKIFEDQVKSLTSGVYSITGDLAEPDVKFIRVFDASSNKARLNPDNGVDDPATPDAADPAGRESEASSAPVLETKSETGVSVIHSKSSS